MYTGILFDIRLEYMTRVVYMALFLYWIDPVQIKFHFDATLCNIVKLSPCLGVLMYPIRT